MDESRSQNVTSGPGELAEALVDSLNRLDQAIMDNGGRRPSETASQSLQSSVSKGMEVFIQRLVEMDASEIQHDETKHCEPELPGKSLAPKMQTLTPGLQEAARKAVTGIISHIDNMTVRAQEKIPATENGEVTKGSNLDIATFSGFYQERAEHMGEIRGLKKKVAHHKSPRTASSSRKPDQDDARSSTSSSGSHLGNDDPEVWKRKLQSRASKSYDEDEAHYSMQQLGEDSLTRPEITTAQHYVDQDFSFGSDEQVLQLRTHLYRQQIYFIFRLAAICFRAKKRYSPLHPLQQTGQLREVVAGDCSDQLSHDKITVLNKARHVSTSNTHPANLLQSCQRNGVVFLNKNKSAMPWILWLLLSSHALLLWVDCRRERTMWLEANGLTRAYMLDLARNANLDFLTII